jgi:hypothetical protein
MVAAKWEDHLVFVGLFIWARIGDQRQCSFVTGYPWPTARL